MQMMRSPVHQWAQSSPSLLALKTPERDYTWQQLAERVDQVAQQLSAQGLRRSDVLLCVGKNSPELVLTYLACMEIGVVCAMTMPQTQQELDLKLASLYRVGQVPKIWFTQPDSALAQQQNVHLTSEQVVSSDMRAHGYSANALSSIVFTSGSTGVPKAVVHTSKQHLASARGLLEKFRFAPSDNWLLSLPMYHVSGLAIIYRWLYTGASLKVGTGLLEQDIHGATHASLVATQLQRLLKGDVELSLTHVLLGGSHVPLALSQQAANKGIETWLGYGMTESASTVTAKRVDAVESAGAILPNRKLKLEGNRIYIGGDTLASGYYQQGEVLPILENGWFDTQDLGEWLGDELKIIGRADNQFISGGENIHCEEIESALHKFEGITQVVVVPIEDSEFGHRPVAVGLFPKPFELTAIESHLKRNLAKFKWPIAYYAMPSFLREGGIKISRKAVKEWLVKQLECSSSSELS